VVRIHYCEEVEAWAAVAKRQQDKATKGKGETGCLFGNQGFPYIQYEQSRRIARSNDPRTDRVGCRREGFRQIVRRRLIPCLLGRLLFEERKTLHGDEIMSGPIQVRSGWYRRSSVKYGDAISGAARVRSAASCDE
jgi:hypothetical protein